MIDAARRLDRLTAGRPGMLADLEALVACESPAEDVDATSRCADLVAEIGKRLLGEVPERRLVEGRPHLLWRFGGRPKVLMLAHLDTVWPLGSLASHPFAVTDGRLTGPGCFDMKAGLVQLLHAVAALDRRDGLTILVNSDEEIGSPTSRALIESEAQQVSAALVLEPSADGALKTARKGVSFYRVHVQGRSAHAGLEPERGSNAAVELAHQVLRINELSDPTQQTTVVPTVLSAGTTANTVPAEGRVTVDVRAFTVGEQRRVAAAIRALQPTVPGTAIRVETMVDRPPLAPSASAALFVRAQAAAARLGLPALGGVAAGGGSDGNLTAGVGTPTLDGLGAVGGGAHADDEHVLVDEMPVRAALVAELAADLLGSPDPAPGCP